MSKLTNCNGCCHSDYVFSCCCFFFIYLFVSFSFSLPSFSQRASNSFWFRRWSILARVHKTFTYFNSLGSSLFIYIHFFRSFGSLCWWMAKWICKCQKNVSIYCYSDIYRFRIRSNIDWYTNLNVSSSSTQLTYELPRHRTIQSKQNRFITVMVINVLCAQKSLAFEINSDARTSHRAIIVTSLKTWLMADLQQRPQRTQIWMNWLQ